MLTLCPPGPLARNTSIWRSLSSMATSTSSASGSTSTVADDVWMRPWLSVTGTRCTRCVPPSYLKRGQAPSPCTENVTSLTPPRSLPSTESVSTFSPWRAGVGPVHVVQVTGEEVGLLATLGAADLDDDVAPGVRIRRDHQLAQLVVDGRPGRSSVASQLRLERTSARRRRPRRAARGPPRHRPPAPAAAAPRRRPGRAGGSGSRRAAARPGRRRRTGSARRASRSACSCSIEARRAGTAEDESDTARRGYTAWLERNRSDFLSCSRLKKSV